MAKKKVTKLTYQLCIAIFYSICLSGLGWQICQISLNYFKFDVVSDIKVIMPEDSVHRGNISLAMCIKSEHISNRTIFSRMELKYRNNVSIDNLTIHDQFDVLIRGDEIFFPGNELNLTQFLFHHRSCYVIQNVDGQHPYPIKQRHVIDARYIWFQMFRSFPPIERATLRNFNDLSHENIALIESNTYFIEKLSFPYVDKCINYEKLGLKNRKFAIQQCYIEKQMLDTNKIPYDTVIEYRPEYLQYFTSGTPGKTYFNECKRKYEAYDDCYNEIVFTHLETKKVYVPAIGKIMIWIDFGQFPSYDINSSPRIDPIDFVTYILGAMGSWIGFSFLSYNPIPYFLKVKSTTPSGAEVISESNPSESSQHNASTRLSSIASNHDDRLKRLECLYSRLISHNDLSK